MAQRKKRRTAAQRRATAKLVALNRARARKKKGGTRKRTTSRRKTVKRTVKRQASTRRKTVATRRRTTKRRRATGKRTVRFTRVGGQVYRKNPRFTVRSLMSDLQRGAMDAAAVVGGKAVTRMIANVIPLPGGGGVMMVYAKQAMAALGAGLAAKQFLSPQIARMVLAGGLAAPIETFMRGLPIIGPALSDETEVLGEYGLGYDPYLPIGEGDPYLPIGEYAMEGGEYPEEEQQVTDYEYMQ